MFTASSPIQNVNIFLIQSFCHPNDSKNLKDKQLNVIFIYHFTYFDISKR